MANMEESPAFTVQSNLFANFSIALFVTNLESIKQGRWIADEWLANVLSMCVLTP